MSSFNDYINNNYLEAYNKMLSKNSVRPIVVYVEAEEDVAFWRDVLHHYQTIHQVKFEIKTPTNSRGKSGLISNKNLDLVTGELGNSLLICVDSDYDYILADFYENKEKKERAKKIKDSKYIFQTYAYAIENLKCYSDSLHSICVSTTLNDDISFNFNIFLKTYSEIIYDVFIWHLVFYAKGKDENFTITEFSDIIKFPKEINPNNDGILSLEQLHKRCVEKYHELVEKYPNHISDVEILKKMLQNYGLLSSTSYFFIQGHTLCDNVVLMILKPICKKLRGTKIDEIKDQAKTKQNLKEKLSHYEKRSNNVENVLSLNTNYKNCFLYKKITQDIEVFLQNKK